MIPPGGVIALGVLVGLLSTSIQSVGLTLQRKSHLLEDEKYEQDTKRPPYRRRRWQLGMLMFIVANIVGSTIQITTLPLPVLSTLQASGLVFNSICASLLLQEPFTRYSLIGTLLVALGALLIALYGAIPEPSHSLRGLLLLLGRSEFIAWIIATFVVVLILIGVAFVLAHLSNPASKISRRYRWAGNMNAGGPWMARMKLLRGMSYGCISGILSAHTLLLAKSAVELLVTTFTSANQFLQYQSWLILLGLAVLALSQLYYLHRGLKLCSTSVLYPFVFCIYNITAILDGLIYFHQTDRLPRLHAGLIAVGTVILLAGVVALSWRLHDHSPSSSTHHFHSVPTTPAVPGTAFAPGMGLVDDEYDSSPHTSAPPSPSSPSTPSFSSDHAIRPGRDEEEALALDGDDEEDGPVRQRPSEHTPLLLSRSQRRRTVANLPLHSSSELWDDLHDTSTTTSDWGTIAQPRTSRSRARSAAGILGRRHGEFSRVGKDRDGKESEGSGQEKRAESK
ncbi:MAG: hypothetical protein Q9165_006945 [Trypethelium subeluteriae]